MLELLWELLHEHLLFYVCLMFDWRTRSNCSLMFLWQVRAQRVFAHGRRHQLVGSARRAGTGGQNNGRRFGGVAERTARKRGPWRHDGESPFFCFLWMTVPLYHGALDPTVQWPAHFFLCVCRILIQASLFLIVLFFALNVVWSGRWCFWQTTATTWVQRRCGKRNPGLKKPTHSWPWSCPRHCWTAFLVPRTRWRRTRNGWYVLLWWYMLVFGCTRYVTFSARIQTCITWGVVVVEPLFVYFSFLCYVVLLNIYLHFFDVFSIRTGHDVRRASHVFVDVQRGGRSGKFERETNDGADENIWSAAGPRGRAVLVLSRGSARGKNVPRRTGAGNYLWMQQWGVGAR